MQYLLPEPMPDGKSEARPILFAVPATDSLDGNLVRKAEVVIPAERGRANHLVLHGATIVGVEAIVPGLGAPNRKRAIDALQRPDNLRAEVSGMQVDVAGASQRGKSPRSPPQCLDAHASVSDRATTGG